MTDPYRAFDGQEPWAMQINRGYEIEIHPASGGWLPEIVLTLGENHPSFVFLQSAADKGSFTPAYAVASTDESVDELEAIVRSMPDEISPAPWMKAAIERAGFNYDPIPNSERWAESDELRTRSDQTELVAHV